jgi:hypothetical protein
MRRSVLFVFILSICLSCTKRPVTPTRESRRAIDTLYQLKILELQPTMDSLCQVYMDSFYQVAVDSMLEERMEEMNKLVQ